MKPKEDQIILVDGETRLQVAPPPEFNWQKYPERLRHQGVLYLYIGTIDVPHYRKAEASED